MPDDREKQSAERPIDRLIAIMARLRAPQGGCPWDLEQSFATIAPYTIEEAYEVADAIQRGDMTALREELGDLLLQVVYHARMAEEEGRFDFDAVATAIADKMVARHPHVFGGAEIDGAAAQTRMWEEFKARERAAKAKASATPPSVLDDVPLALPALLRAEKLQKRAARVGFDWPEARQVLDKIEEEIGELRAELDQGAPPARVEDEIGDLLFALANLARHLKVDPETALRGCNAKFERRFHAIERALAAEDRSPKDASLEEMEALWIEAKHREG
ncbi:MAG: nucleoside triphosphate pyrophosphohydrolase [Alphaproteobacteria bacterium]|nr:nucleoside triphosphate pyrophosphohydrolase [Alphaproteobacteria bacterium]